MSTGKGQKNRCLGRWNANTEKKKPQPQPHCCILSTFSVWVPKWPRAGILKCAKSRFPEGTSLHLPMSLWCQEEGKRTCKGFSKVRSSSIGWAPAVASLHACTLSSMTFVNYALLMSPYCRYILLVRGRVYLCLNMVFSWHFAKFSWPHAICVLWILIKCTIMYRSMWYAI